VAVQLRRRRRRIAKQPRELLLRRISATITSTTAGQALPGVRQLPGLRDRRARPAATSARACWSGTCRRFRSRRSVSPGFFPRLGAPAIFVGALAARPADGSGRRTVYNAGTQVDLRFTVMSRLNMTLSFGYAAGFEDGRKLDEESGCSRSRSSSSSASSAAARRYRGRVPAISAHFLPVPP
jgi:hypothetical protein